MARTPEFSIIVTARNEGPALVPTLNHLARLASNYNGEVIVVDDDSEIPVMTWVQHNPGVRYIQLLERHGAARAANAGVSQSSGEYLIFIDAHACFDPNVISVLRAAYAEDSEAVFGCTTQMVSNYEMFQARATERPCNAFSAGVDDIRYGWMFDKDAPGTTKAIRDYPGSGLNGLGLWELPYVSACGMSVRRAVFDDIGGFDQGLLGFGSAQDSEFCCHAWSMGHRVKLLSELNCWHYTAPNRAPDIIPRLPLMQADWPQYPGSTMNELRIAYMYFPDEFYDRAVRRVARVFHMLRVPAQLPMDIPTEWTIRYEQLLNDRRCTPEWMLKRMTTT